MPEQEDVIYDGTNEGMHGRDILNLRARLKTKTASIAMLNFMER